MKKRRIARSSGGRNFWKTLTFRDAGKERQCGRSYNESGKGKKGGEKIFEGCVVLLPAEEKQESQEMGGRLRSRERKSEEGETKRKE